MKKTVPILCILIILHAASEGATLKITQLTFNGTGGEPLPNPGIPFTPRTLPEGWKVWPEHHQNWPYLFGEEFLYLHNGEETITLDHENWSIEYFPEFTWFNEGEHIYWTAYDNGSGNWPPELYNNGKYYLINHNPYPQTMTYANSPNYFYWFSLYSDCPILHVISWNSMEEIATGSIADIMPGYVEYFIVNAIPYVNGVLCDVVFYESLVHEQFFFEVIPEPASLLLVGLGGIALRYRRKK